MIKEKRTQPQKVLIHPDTIIHEISNAVRRISRILKQYDDVGNGLDTQIQLKITHHRLLYCTLNSQWHVNIKDAVKRVITSTAKKYPQIISISITP